MKMLKIVFILAVLLLVGFFLLRWLLPAISPAPDGLGIENGRLSPCPDSPNCVSTFADDAEHGMEAWRIKGKTAVYETLLEHLSAMPNVTIITTEPNYIHAEFRTPFLRLIDDVEFVVDSQNEQINFRSASRLGYSDFGLNRKRMIELEKIMME